MKVREFILRHPEWNLECSTVNGFWITGNRWILDMEVDSVEDFGRYGSIEGFESEDDFVW